MLLTMMASISLSSSSGLCQYRFGISKNSSKSAGGRPFDDWAGFCCCWGGDDCDCDEAEEVEEALDWLEVDADLPLPKDEKSMPFGAIGCGFPGVESVGVGEQHL